MDEYEDLRESAINISCIGKLVNLDDAEKFPKPKEVVEWEALLKEKETEQLCQKMRHFLVSKTLDPDYFVFEHRIKQLLKRVLKVDVKEFENKYLNLVRTSEDISKINESLQNTNGSSLEESLNLCLVLSGFADRWFAGKVIFSDGELFFPRYQEAVNQIRTKRLLIYRQLYGTPARPKWDLKLYRPEDIRDKLEKHIDRLYKKGSNQKHLLNPKKESHPDRLILLEAKGGPFRGFTIHEKAYPDEFKGPLVSCYAVEMEFKDFPGYRKRYVGDLVTFLRSEDFRKHTGYDCVILGGFQEPLGKLASKHKLKLCGKGIAENNQFHLYYCNLTPPKP